MASFLGKITPARSQVVYEHMTPDGPVQMTRPTPNPRITLAGHAVLTFLFYGCLAAYFVYAVLAYINQEPATAVVLRPADQFPVLPLNFTARCKTPACGPIHMISNYSAFPSSPCFTYNGGVAGSVTLGYKDVVAVDGVPVTLGLCYTAQEGISMAQPGAFPVSMIQVAFTGFNGTAELLVRSHDGALNRLLNIESGGHVRALQVGINVETLDGAVTALSPYSLLFQTEGERVVTEAARSEALIQMMPLANVREGRTVRSAWVLVSSIGSAFDTLTGIFVVLLPVWALIFAASRRRQELAQAWRDRNAQRGKYSH